MQVSWFSRQGRGTRTNNDAVALGFKGDFLLAMLVDAAEKGSNGQGLARHWARTIVDAALAGTQPPDCASIIRLLSEQQRELRHHYLHEIASYCCVLIDLQTCQVHILHTGDCLVGTRQPSGRLQWLITPHTLSNQPLSPESFPAGTYGHVLTRSLNARRFYPPAYFTTAFDPATEILLSTDGYWNEHLEQGVDLQQLQDDASLLCIAPGTAAESQKTDCDNFVIIQPRTNLPARGEQHLKDTP
jgi:serine/threonine protein phosphatase PrpC